MIRGLLGWAYSKANLNITNYKILILWCGYVCRHNNAIYEGDLEDTKFINSWPRSGHR